jgi:hypothetical protein
MKEITGQRTKMHFGFRLLLPIPPALLIAVLAITCLAQAREFGDLSVRVESVASSLGYGGGYEELRATIVNSSSERNHQVTLVAPGNAGGASVLLRRTVDVAASSTSQVSLFRPLWESGSLDVAVIIDGERQKAPVLTELNRTAAWVRRSFVNISLLISDRVNSSKLMSEPAVEEGLKDRSGEIYVAYLPYDVPLNEWSANWLGYTQFDGIIITSDDLREMPSGVRSALWSYLECGGSLLVIGSWEVPNEWRSRQQMITSATSRKNDLPFYQVGFGSLILTGTVDPRQIEASQWSEIHQHWEASHPETVPYENYKMPADINREFPVVDGLGIPVRGFFFMMIAFVIVIGPLNLLWLSRRKKKIWLLWTVPAISLLTSFGVSAFALFGEGLGATARMEGLTILDEVSHRATSIGWIGLYSPVMPGDGLRFSFDTELTPKRYRSMDLPGNGSVRTIDWSKDQHLVSEWITARVPVYFQFRKSEARRERLTVRRGANDSIGIVNGLGSDIRQLWWADNTGEIYTATNIPSGQEARLTPINLKAAGAADNLREVYTGNWLEMFNKLEVNPRESLAPGCYLAVTDASPFVEDGLRNVKVRKAKTLVYGIQNNGQ